MVTSRDEPLVPDSGTRLSGQALGIDIGGTGVKAGLVDLATGELISERIRERTPQPALPSALAATVASVVAKVLDGHVVPDDLPVGVGLPGVITDGHLRTAANLDKSWVDAPAEDLLGAAIGRRVYAINDADAAGVAEMSHGAGKGVMGTVLVLTIGTGIGSALFIEGRLVPNCEFGHIELHGRDAESLVSGAARERRHRGWRRWAREFNVYLAHMESYVWPELIILGGGVSKELPKYQQWLVTRAPVRAAVHLNSAGILGAAAAAGYAARLAEAKAHPTRPPRSTRSTRSAGTSPKPSATA